MDQFLIGDILVRMDYLGVPVISEGNLRHFCHDGDWEGDRVTLECSAEPLARFLDQPLREDDHVYGIYRHGEQPLLVYHWGTLFHGFAVWPRRFAVTFDPKMYRQTPLREDWFFSVCGFHRQLLLRNACVLHASYVDIGGEAILFTGPSNIGKSTQAGLWAAHAGAGIVNGDRALLRKRDGRWHAFGYPCCGTSGICINRTLPLKAIVVLSQSADNRVEPLSAGAKLRGLTSAMELYPWDGGELDMALRVAQDVICEVPVVRLCCRPDSEAVEVLKTYLEEHT